MRCFLLFNWFCYDEDLALALAFQRHWLHIGYASFFYVALSRRIVVGCLSLVIRSMSLVRVIIDRVGPTLRHGFMDDIS